VGATGAGAEMGRSLGTAVFAGILGVTGFGLIFTPAFYTACLPVARQAALIDPDQLAGGENGRAQAQTLSARMGSVL
jgi:hypothetical protein